MTPISIVALFCEDIRLEKSDQITLIGVMPDNVHMSLPPKDGTTRALPKICIYTRLNFDPKADIGPIESKLVFPDGNEQEIKLFPDDVVQKAQRESLEKSTPIVGVYSRLDISPLPLPKLGRMRIEATVNGVTYLCGALNFEEPSTT